MQSSGAVRSRATVELAELASRLEFGDIPAKVVQKAKLCVLDTIGCCVYGVTVAPAGKLLRMVLAGEAHPAAQ